MARTNLPPAETFGDDVKNTVDSGMASGMRRIWKGIREFGAGSFAKGAAITALVVIGVTALVAGYMGANSGLAVNNSLITTFERGFGEGISKAIEFLTHGLGIATLAAGGAVGVASDIMKNQHKQAALESERLAAEYKRSREQGKERTQNQSQSQQSTTEIKETTRTTQETAPAKEKTSAPTQDKGIYVKGSITKTTEYMAAELKRRSERETHAETHLG